MKFNYHTTHEMTENYSYICKTLFDMIEKETYITTGIGFNIELYEEMEVIREKEGISRSQYVQTSVRKHNLKIKKQTASEILNNMNESEIDILKDEIKKRG